MDAEVVVVRDLNEIRYALGEPERVAAEPPVFRYIWACGCEGRTDDKARTWRRCPLHRTLPHVRRHGEGRIA